MVVRRKALEQLPAITHLSEKRKTANSTISGLMIAPALILMIITLT